MVKNPRFPGQFRQNIPPNHAFGTVGTDAATLAVTLYHTSSKVLLHTNRQHEAEAPILGFASFRGDVRDLAGGKAVKTDHTNIKSRPCGKARP
jgi:hypothetical protein